MKERPIIFNSKMVRAILSGQKTQTRLVSKANPDEYEDIGLFCAENPCKYGEVGDRLWVRETFILLNERPDILEPAYAYRANKLDREILQGRKWNPSIFMPRSASRIMLEITGVRVERLHDISVSDAGNEGCGGYFEYINLWESINSAGSWDANPWVFVVEFKRVEDKND